MVLDTEIEAFLVHYGVKGMRWGVRKKEESSGGNNSSKEPSVTQRLRERNVQINTERKATLRARAAKADVRINEINKQLESGMGSSRDRGKLRAERMNLREQKVSDLQKAEKQSTTGLTSTQKKVLIGAGIAGAALATYGAYRFLGTEGGRAQVRSLQSRLQYGDVFKPDPSLAAKMSPNEVLQNVSKQVNPNYNVQGGMMNCRRCTFAYELRRRGYDVQATTAAIGQGQSESGLVNALIKGDKDVIGLTSMSANAGRTGDNPLGIRKRLPGDTRVLDAFQESIPFQDSFGNAGGMASKIKDSLSKHPTGARGEIVFDQYSFAHSLQWEIFDGVPHLFDSQKGQHFPVTEEGIEKFISKWGPSGSAEITRLDNVDLDLAFLSRWARNAA